MSSVAYVEQQLQSILEERANELARETGCIKRERKFSGADLVQTLVFGWQQQPDASLGTVDRKYASKRFRGRIRLLVVSAKLVARQNCLPILEKSRSSPRHGSATSWGGKLAEHLLELVN